MRFDPRLPESWDRLAFRIQVRGQLLGVEMTHTATTYTLLAGRGLLIEHRGEELRLTPGDPAVMPPAARQLRRAA